MSATRHSLRALVVVAALAAPVHGQNGGSDEPGAAAEQNADVEVDVSDEGLRQPLGSRNQMPLALLFAYLAPESARALDSGEVDLALRFDYSNIIITQETERERVHFDTEYLRTELDVRRGFGAGFELGASIPFYAYYGGFLDPLVDGFHETLGLPNSLRGQTPFGLSRAEYLRGDDALFRAEGSFGGVGDLSLHFKKTLYDDDRIALAARSILKVSTGSLDRVTGSGAADAGFGVAFDRVSDRFAVFANANYHLLGSSELLPTKDYFSFMVGVDWRFKPTLAAVLQVDHARPPLEGEVKMFNKGIQQLALGLRWRYSDRFVYEWRFVEDLSSFSPDFTVAFELGIRFPPASHSR